MHVSRYCKSWRQKCGQEVSRDYFRIQIPHNRNSAHVECESKSDSSNKGATGTISESFRQYLSNIAGKHEIKKLQKNSHNGHCTHTAESANVKVRNIFHGRSNITCSYRTPATLHTLETWFFFRYVIVNTLHKGDKKDDDDSNNNNNNNACELNCPQILVLFPTATLLTVRDKQLLIVNIGRGRKCFWSVSCTVTVASRVGEILGKNSNIRRKKHDVTSTYVESALLAAGVTEERLGRKQ